jgi:predicted flap endonuclease-1-like 5' DNA nuclease
MSLGNPTNIVIIALLGVAALLFIIASFGGGGKWRRMYHQEAEEYAAYADRADQDLRGARQRITELERAYSELQQRHAETEAAIAQTESATPAAIAAPVGTVVAAAPEPHPILGERASMTELPPAPIMGMTPLRAEEPVEAEFTPAPEPAVEVAPAILEAEPAPVEAAEEPAKAWFGAGKRDDLTRMRGVDATVNTRLFGLGITSFDDVVHLSQEDEMALEQRLDLPAGYITREQWRDQASLLRFGKDAEFDERFGSAGA